MIIYFVSVSHGLASRLHCIKLEYSFRLKIKCNDWLLAAKQPSSQSLCFFFESETVLKFFNLEARS